MSFEKYLNTVSGNYKRAVKIEWLNPDETVNFEFTNHLYNIDVDLSVNYQNGSRRSCTLTLNNDRNQFPINFNNLWIGQKFKLWLGLYIDKDTPYYIPQGVFYVSNPEDVYQPQTKTIKINGVDKWAYLDGTLHGKLSGIYQTNINDDLYDATKKLLKLPIGVIPLKRVNNNNIGDYFDIKNKQTSRYFKYNTSTLKFEPFYEKDNSSEMRMNLTAKKNMSISLRYDCNLNYYNIFTISKGASEESMEIIVNEKGSKFSSRVLNLSLSANEVISFSYEKNSGTSGGCAFYDIKISFTDDIPVDPIPPFISPIFLGKQTYIPTTDKSRKKNKTYYKLVDGEYTPYTGSGTWSEISSELYVLAYTYKCPYTAKVERGKSYADVLLEYATILCAHIYYDVNGRLTIEPMIDTADDITDTDKEVLWHYSVDEQTFLGLTQTYNFENIYNDFIVLGNIVNGYQFKSRVQNQNLLSDTCVQKIGYKTKDPIEDNQYFSDEQCRDLAVYYAKIDTILQKSGNIDSITLYHLDVNKLITISTPNNNMSKELFLITGFNLNSSGKMSINITSVNVLKDFSVVEVDMYE